MPVISERFASNTPVLEANLVWFCKTEGTDYLSLSAKTANGHMWW